MSDSIKVITVAILFLTILFIFTRKKQWNYDRVKLIEYNKEFNEKHPVIDTIKGLYKNTRPILVRSGFKIQGHDKIGVATGGAQLYFECSDTCRKCIPLSSDR
jgi:amino acid permease